MNRHYAPAGADLWNAPRTLTLTIPLWDEATEHQPRTLRTPARAMEVPVILWPELEVAGAVVHAQGYAAVETFIVLREWNAQVLLHELLHVALGGVIPAAQDGTGGHDVIGAVEVALAPFVTFPTPVSSGEAGTGEVWRCIHGKAQGENHQCPEHIDRNWRLIGQAQQAARDARPAPVVAPSDENGQS